MTNILYSSAYPPNSLIFYHGEPLKISLVCRHFEPAISPSRNLFFILLPPQENYGILYTKCHLDFILFMFLASSISYSCIELIVILLGCLYRDIEMKILRTIMCKRRSIIDKKMLATFDHGKEANLELINLSI